jgi:hypothetical protein
MVRATIQYALSILTCSLLYGVASSAPPRAAYEMLPAETQAVIWVPSADTLLERFNLTQLGRLTTDPAFSAFWLEQRAQIESDLTSAGWRLQVQPRDLVDVASGQVAMGWIERRGEVRKPYSLALIVDIVDRVEAAQTLLNNLQQQMTERGARVQTANAGAVEIVHYTLPRQNGELLPQETCHAIVNQQLLVADDLPTLQGLIQSAQAPAAAPGMLSADAVFTAGREELRMSNEAQLEYFVRPLGFARVLRAVSGKRPTGAADVLAVLENQGFDAIRCVVGEVQLAGQHDVLHRGFVLADPQLPRSVQVLDFPNQVQAQVPNWATENTANLTLLNWNVGEAFWKVEGLVDEMAGQPGVFREIINGIASDPTGPQINIAAEVMPLLTNDIYALSDVDATRPIDVDSRRNLIALRLRNPQAMLRVLQKAMANEPDAEQVDIEGQVGWQVVHKEDQASDIDLSADFGQFGGTPAGGAGEGAGQEPLLSNWAITVHDEFLMFASHVDLIAETIRQARSGGASPLAQADDYNRVAAALQEQFGSAPLCVHNINRNELSFRSQYELFREGKLQDSQSMFAMLLENVVQNKPELKRATPVISGEKLPPYERIAHYFQPSGTVVSTTPRGWAFGSVMVRPGQGAQ